jgi:hypothetical protein
VTANLEFTVTRTQVIGVVNYPNRQPENFLLQRFQCRQPVYVRGRKDGFSIGIKQCVSHGRNFAIALLAVYCEASGTGFLYC